MKLVLTGPAATPYAREYISNAGATLRERGYEVFIPHEAGWQPPEDPIESNRFDFEATYQALREAELLIALLDGYNVDDAVAAQIGAFHAHAREGSHPRKIIGLLHDTRMAGWDWSGGDRSLTPQIRQSVLEFGVIYPTFKRALAALESGEI